MAKLTVVLNVEIYVFVDKINVIHLHLSVHITSINMNKNTNQSVKITQATHWMNFIAESMNAFLLAAVAAMAEYLVEPSVHPPTASSTFRRGLRLFMLTNLSRASEEC